jgi:CDP-glycerol glycerophosphotransferase (TagB/SpsB family)
MNRAHDSKWGQEGIYVTFNYDISDPAGWSKPQQIQKGGNWYPQIFGTGAGETDKLAGRKARFFVGGKSNSEILFLAPGEIE